METSLCWQRFTSVIHDNIKDCTGKISYGADNRTQEDTWWTPCKHSYWDAEASIIRIDGRIETDLTELA